jgi:DNA-binding transcriptional ArsR family regulator
MAEILDKKMLKALSTETRQEIIKMLLKRPYTASELSKMLNRHVTTITEHLNILEKSGLISKKDTTNKWIYYALTEKGEKLFKTSYYSWVVVFAISAVLMFTGFLRIFTPAFGPLRSDVAQSTSGALEASKVPDITAKTGVVDFMGMALIALAIIGFAYLGYRIWKSRKMLKNATMYVEYAML